MSPSPYEVGKSGGRGTTKKRITNRSDFKRRTAVAAATAIIVVVVVVGVIVVTIVSSGSIIVGFSVSLLDNCDMQTDCFALMDPPVPEENDPSRDTLFPYAGVDSWYEDGAPLSLHSGGTLREDNDGDVARCR